MKTIVFKTMVPYNRSALSKRLGTRAYDTFKSSRIRPAKWLMALGMMMMLSVSGLKAATYYLTTAGANAAQTPSNWSDAGIGGGGKLATNFTTSGDIFEISSGTNGVVNGAWVFGNSGSAAALTLNVKGTLTLNNSFSLTLQQKNGGTNTVNITGSIIFAGTSANQLVGATSGSGAAANNAFNLSSGATLKTANTVGIVATTGNNSINSTSLVATLDAGANYEFNNATTAQGAIGLPTTLNTLTINNAAGVNFAVIHTISTVTIGNVTANSILNDGGFQITSTGTLNLLSGTLKLGNSAATIFPAFTTRNISSGTTIEYASNVAQTVSVTPTYQNLTFSGTGTKTPTASSTLTVGGNFTSTANFVHNSGTLLLNGTGAQSIISGGSSFNNLTITNTGGTCTAATNGITIAGTLTSNASTTLDMGTNTLSVATVTHSGTLKTQNTSSTPISTGKTWGGTVEYNGTAQTVSTGTYNNLTLSGSGVKTISSTTVNGAFTMNGTSTVSAAPTYGSAATLIYNKGAAFEAGVEWITPFTSSGGISITGAGTITVPSSKVLDGAAAIPLSIGSGASLDVAATYSLTVDGDITNAGALTLKCGTTGGPATLINSGTITGAGTCKMEQYLEGFGDATTPTGRGWYISSPVSNAPRSMFTDNVNGHGCWEWDEVNQGYLNPAGNLAPKKGYVFRDGVTQTKTFSGSSFNTGNQDMTGLTYTGALDKRGYNLIGNPYPSYLDFHALTKTNVMTTMWFCETAAKTTPTMRFATYNTEGPDSTFDATRSIPPMQSVWVKVMSNAGGSLGVPNTARVHNRSGFLRSSTIASQRTLLRLRVASGSIYDEAVISFNADASDDLDKFDSEKMSNNSASIPEISSIVNGTALTINGMSKDVSTKVLPLKFFTKTAGTFTISAAEMNNFESDARIILTDNQLNIQQNLIESPTYSFSSGATTSNDRFTLTFINTPTIIDNAVTAERFTVLTNANGNIQVQLIDMESQGALICLYNASGQRLLSQRAEGITTTIGKSLPHGFYVIEVQKDGYKGLKKIVINQ